CRLRRRRQGLAAPSTGSRGKTMSSTAGWRRATGRSLPPIPTPGPWSTGRESRESSPAACSRSSRRASGCRAAWLRPARGSAVAQLYDDVVGQDEAVAQLRAAARSPVHAYLLLGPSGTGKRRAAMSFAASLVCEGGADGACEDRVLRGSHPDVVVRQR